MQITVMGEATLERVPERGNLYLNVGIESSDKQRAVRETTEVVNRIAADIERLRNLDPAPVTKSSVSPLSIWSWTLHDPNGKPQGLQHRAASSVQVTFSDFAALSQFVDSWGQQTGVAVSHVEWTLTDESRTALEREVLAMAVTRAQERARVIAESCRLTSLAFTEVSDPGLLSGGRNERMMMDMPQPMSMRNAKAMSAMGDGGSVIEIAPEDVRTTAVLHVRFSAD